MRVFDKDLRLEKPAGRERARGAAETLRDYGRFMAKLGITRLANITGLDFIGVPVYAAVRPNARTVSVSQGKGLDSDGAKVAALMESIEMWHAEQVVAPLRRDSYNHLRRTARVVDVARFLRPGSRWRPFDPAIPITWIEGYDLIQRTSVWVPEELVALSDVFPADWMPTFQADSNGLASGNHLLEPILFGLCEVIERDAISLWFTLPDETAGKASQIDLAEVRHPGCRELLARLARADILVGAYDATSDLGIPTYNAIIFDRPTALRRMGYFWGSASHLDPEVALEKSIAEAIQCRLTEISGVRDDIRSAEYDANRGEDELAEMEQMLLHPPPPRSLYERSSLSTSSFEGDIQVVLDALQRAGLDSAIVVDLTHPELQIPVSKVIVPGLEGAFESAYVPGERARALAEKSAS